MNPNTVDQQVVVLGPHGRHFSVAECGDYVGATHSSEGTNVDPFALSVALEDVPLQYKVGRPLPQLGFMGTDNDC